LSQAKSQPFVVHNDSEQPKEHLVLLPVHTMILNQGICNVL
jgi:hypothetical protein